MVDSLQSLSDGSGAVDDGSDADAVLDSLLRDGEMVQFVLTSSKAIEQTENGQTTTVQPSSNHDAYAIITDHRVLYLVGSDAEELTTDIEFELYSVTMAKARSSLLSSSLVVSEESTSVKFTPSGSPDLEEISDYIDRIGSSWADLHRAIAATNRSIESFQETLQAGDDAQEELNQARSDLSNAHHHATHNDDGPTEVMLQHVSPLEAELDSLQVEIRLERVDKLLTEANDRDTFDGAVRSLFEASDRLDEALDALDDDAFDGDTAMETIEARSNDVDALAATLLGDAEKTCHRAIDSADVSTAATTWEDALGQYRTLLAENWGGLAGVDADALRFQLAWVVGSTIDAQCTLASELESEGDELGDDGDEATERYERAKQHIESARTLADEHQYVDVDRIDTRLDEIDEKIEVSEWQWGSA